MFRIYGLIKVDRFHDSQFYQDVAEDELEAALEKLRKNRKVYQSMLSYERLDVQEGR